MSELHIPKTYEEWRHCITVTCSQPLTRDYIDARIQALKDQNDYTTQKFIALYGLEQHRMTVKWFEQAKAAL